MNKPADSPRLEARVAAYMAALSAFPFSEADKRDVATFAAIVDEQVESAAAENIGFHDEPAAFEALLETGRRT